jgi:protein involved in polysaccharide export with SLBB domain
MNAIKIVLCLWLISFASWSFADTDDVIEIGNKIQLHMSDEEEFKAPFEVDELGFLTLPELGKFEAAGKTRQQLESELSRALSQVYKNMSQFYIEVVSRDLLITVLGYVENPDLYSIPRKGNVQMVIAKAGGLKPGAQLNKLQVRRGDERFEFDYKRYLDTGDTNVLPQLQSGDTIFVPVSPLLGNVQIDFDAQTLSASGDASKNEQAVVLLGELHKPGSYSFKENMTIIDAIMRANGVTRYADVTKIRVITEGQPQLFNLKKYLDSGDSQNLPKLEAGTTVYVPISVEDVNTNANMVYVMGEVQKPGAYETTGIVSFLDILANAGGPTRFAETTQIRILTADGANKYFDLHAYSEGLNPEKVPTVGTGDVIFVPEKTDINEKSWLKVPPTRAIKIIGAVQSPGRYEWSSEMDFTDLLAHAGGPTKGANTNSIKVVRDGKVTQTFNLDDYVLGQNSAPLPDLSSGDTIIVEELPQDPSDNKSQWVRQSPRDSIYIMGQVRAPGRYAFNQNMHFIDILAAADGPNDSADIRNIRVTHRNTNEAKVSKIDLALYFETGDETLLPQVTMGDTIYIPEKSRDWLQKPQSEVVRVFGAIAKPGRYSFDHSMNLLDILAEAGGPNNNAMIDKIIVINHGCCKEQARTFNLDRYVRHPDSRLMPVLRPGDTVYVPGKDLDTFTQQTGSIIDLLTILALALSL